MSKHILTKPPKMQNLRNFLVISFILSLGIVSCNGACRCGSNSFCSHPSRCELFYQCSGDTEYLMMCGENSYFSSSQLVCINTATSCTSSCEGKAKVANVYHCRRYHECVNNKPLNVTEECPLGNRFSEALGQCVVDPNCPPPNNNALCSDLFMPSLTPGKYLQKDGSSWIQKDCAENLIFNITKCTCLPSGNQTVTVPTCLNITLPLSNNLLSDGYNYYVKGKSVFFSGNALQFNGSTVLTVPALANNEIGSYFRLSLSFKTQLSGSQALVNNNNCSNTGTFRLYLNSGSVVASITLRDNSQDQVHSLTASLGTSNTWKTVTLLMENNEIKLLVNSVIISRKFVSGVIPIQACPMYIGEDINLPRFQGSMRDVSVRKCPN